MTGPGNPWAVQQPSEVFPEWREHFGHKGGAAKYSQRTMRSYAHDLFNNPYTETVGDRMPSAQQMDKDTTYLGPPRHVHFPSVQSVFGLL